MHYKFIDTTDPPQYERGLLTKYGATVLDEMEGVTTLSVKGRSNISRSFNTLSPNDGDRDYVISSRINTIRIDVLLKLEARNDYAMRALGDRLSELFLGYPEKLQFSDDVYYYMAILEEISYEETANQVLATLHFRSEYPYKFREVQGQGSIFYWHTTLPVVPDEIICTARVNAESFALTNKRSGQSIRLNRQISQGQIIEIRPAEYFGITVDGQNAMADLVPSSEFERFELSFKDELITRPESRILIKAKIIKLG